MDEVRQRKMTEKLAARIGRNQRTGKMSEEVGTWGVPVTNYGMALAYMQGILKRSIKIFKEL